MVLEARLNEAEAKVTEYGDEHTSFNVCYERAGASVVAQYDEAYRSLREYEQWLVRQGKGHMDNGQFSTQ